MRNNNELFSGSYRIIRRLSQYRLPQSRPCSLGVSRRSTNEGVTYGGIVAVQQTLQLLRAVSRHLRGGSCSGVCSRSISRGGRAAYRWRRRLRGAAARRYALAL